MNNNPRVSDIIIHIPNKYFSKVFGEPIVHDMWYNLTKKGLSKKDMNIMLNKYHDSDSAKDYNPLYYIVNRPIKYNHNNNNNFNKQILD
jgi:hypothetical protein